MKENNKKFVNDLKVRTIFPFYIDSINPNFFGSINKFNNKVYNRKIYQKLSSLNIEELKKLSKIEGISSHSTILLLINRIIKKIVSKTGTKKNDLFIEKGLDKNNQPLYVEEKIEIYDFKVIGNTQSDRRYIYAVDIDKDTYLFNYVEQIQFSFYLDEKNNMISGGVSWNWGNDNKPNSTENVIEKTYITSLIKYFISREFKEITLNNILTILDDWKSKDNNNLLKIKKSWNDLVESKIIDGSNMELKLKKYLLNELFYSILITLMVSLAVVEELKIYFRHDKPEIYQVLLKKGITYNNNDDQDCVEDFENILDLIKKNYFTATKTNFKKISDADDFIQALINFDKKENIYFGNLLLSYEIIRNSDIPFFDEEDDIFMNSKDLKLLFILTMKPEMLGIDNTSHEFIKYKELINLIKSFDFENDEWEESINSYIDKTICEWNYDYVSFLNKDLTILIIKNNNPIDFVLSKKLNYDYDANRKLFNNYLWSQIYAHAIIYKIKDKEQKFNQNKIKYPHLLRQYIYDVEQLHFDWYDDFYGLPQLKKIIKKIDDFKELNKSISLLNKKINKEDKIYGKSKERENIAFAFIAASIFGITDFLTTVYTILTVSNPQNGFKLENFIVIGIGIFLALIMFCMLLYTIINPIIKKHKHKKNGG